MEHRKIIGLEVIHAAYFWGIFSKEDGPQFEMHFYWVSAVQIPQSLRAYLSSL